MFVIMMHYNEPLEVVDKYLAEHRSFLEIGYQNNYFIVSGPQNPRTGGIIISQLKDKEQLEKILQQDPFHVHGIADYELIEFSPVKYHKDFSKFVD
jgi:uncharacterized protein YciI